MIRFGSRVDVYLPEGARPLVAEGQTAIAGETIIADLRAADARTRIPRRLTQSRLHRSNCINERVRVDGRRAVAAGHDGLYSRAWSFRRSSPTAAAQRRRFRPIPVRTLLPNLITLLALCAGLTAIRLAVEDQARYGRSPRSCSRRCSTASTGAWPACSRAPRASAPSSTASPTSSISAWRRR